MLRTQTKNPPPPPRHMYTSAEESYQIPPPNGPPVQPALHLDTCLQMPRYSTIPQIGPTKHATRAAGFQPPVRDVRRNPKP